MPLNRIARPSAWVGVAMLLALSFPGCANWNGGSSSQPPAFSLQVAPANLEVPAGGSGYAVVTATRGTGFTGPVTLSLPGLPSGVSATGAIPGDDRTGYLTIVVDGGVTPQTWANLELEGRSGGVASAAGFSLTVATPLPASSLSPDLAMAPGGVQVMGPLTNAFVLMEPVAHDSGSNPSGSLVNVAGFLPDAEPFNP